MVACVERRFGISNAPRKPSNGSPTTARLTSPRTPSAPQPPWVSTYASRQFVPESNGIAEAFVKTFKRDYARLSILPDAPTVIMLLLTWFEFGRHESTNGYDRDECAGAIGNQDRGVETERRIGCDVISAARLASKQRSRKPSAFSRKARYSGRYLPGQVKPSNSLFRQPLKSNS